MMDLRTRKVDLETRLQDLSQILQDTQQEMLKIAGKLELIAELLNDQPVVTAGTNHGHPVMERR